MTCFESMGELGFFTSGLKAQLLLALYIYDHASCLRFARRLGFVHGLICPESIFVTKNGEFKLWSLELLSNVESEMHYFQARENTLSALAGARFRSPERENGEWEKVKRSFAMTDVWSLGHTIPALFNGPVPLELDKLQKKMVHPQPVARAKVARLLQSECLASHPYVKSMLFIEEIALKSHPELLAFFRGLGTSMQLMPNQTRVGKLIPALRSGKGPRTTGSCLPPSFTVGNVLFHGQGWSGASGLAKLQRAAAKPWPPRSQLSRRSASPPHGSSRPRLRPLALKTSFLVFPNPAFDVARCDTRRRSWPSWLACRSAALCLGRSTGRTCCRPCCPSSR